MQLTGKNVFITGGARGFGKAFARLVLEAGGKVVLLDLKAPLGIDTAEEFNKTYGPGSALFIRCNVADQNQLKGSFEKAVEVYGHLDMVVNNAGIGNMSDYRMVVDVDLNAVIHGNYLALEHMRMDKGGRGGTIVNIGSTAGLTAVAYAPVYSAAKHGVVGLSRSLGAAAEPLGVKIMCLCPSFTKTDGFMESRKKGYQHDSSSSSASLVGAVGIMEVENVVQAFEKLIHDEHAGSVMAVTPKGMAYQFPRRLRAAKL